MSTGYLGLKVLSVSGAVRDPRLDSQFVAVHGTLYVGEECLAGEFLLLPKDGRFDGQDPGIVRIADRRSAILIADDRIGPKFSGLPKACGSYIHKYDAIVVGRIRWQPILEYQVSLTELTMIIMQDEFPLPKGPALRDLYVMDFTGESFSRAGATECVRTKVPCCPSPD